MDATVGTGTLNPPGDGDNIAKVAPLRRREPHLVGLPRIRDPLPAESAPFDAELEPADVQLRRSRKRRAGAAPNCFISWTSSSTSIPAA